MVEKSLKDEAVSTVEIDTPTIRGEDEMKIRNRRSRETDTTN